MFISFPVPHADRSVNSNHKKGSVLRGMVPFLFVMDVGLTQIVQNTAHLDVKSSIFVLKTP